MRSCPVHVYCGGRNDPTDPRVALLHNRWVGCVRNNRWRFRNDALSDGGWRPKITAHLISLTSGQEGISAGNKIRNGKGAINWQRLPLLGGWGVQDAAVRWFKWLLVFLLAW